jgi:two-component system, sensor histidine kinase LadS
VSALLMAESALGKPPELPVGVSLVSLQVLEDKSGAQSIDQVRQSLSRFQPSPAGIANYGFTASAYWFRLVLRNRNRRPQELFFRIRHPSLDHASLFVLNSSGPPTRVTSGDRMPAENRAYPATSIVLPFRLEP